MIYFIGHPAGIQTHLDAWAPSFAPRVHAISYPQLFRARRLPLGTYVFSDLDELAPSDAERAARIWAHLASCGQDLQLLNHPTRSMLRYELLRMLHDEGVNGFDVYRVTERRRPTRFPVFLRVAHEHPRDLGPLLHTPEQLDAALADLVASGRNRDQHLVVEFADTADCDGIYRKYSAFVIGTRVVAGHVLVSKNWVTKRFDLSEEAWHREEREFVRTNPHARPLTEICARAGIQYGRVDYAVCDGRLFVWEINTNPYLAAPEPPDSPRHEACAESARQLNESLAAVDSPHHRTAAASAWTLNPLWPARVRARQRWVLHAGLHMTGLARHEARVADWLVGARATLRRLLARLRRRPPTPR